MDNTPQHSPISFLPSPSGTQGLITQSQSMNYAVQKPWKMQIVKKHRFFGRSEQNFTENKQPTRTIAQENPKKPKLPIVRKRAMGHSRSRIWRHVLQVANLRRIGRLPTKKLHRPFIKDLVYSEFHMFGLRLLILYIVLPAAMAGQTPGGAPSPLTITLEDALTRAKSNATQLLSANIARQLAREDTLQAKSALLPGVNGISQYIYTQPNGAPSGVFVANDGPNIYNNQLAVHGDIYAPAKIADYHRIKLAEEIARARAEIATRGIVATVVQNYYGMVNATRRLANAQQSEREAEQFLEITRKQERGGEVAHSDVVKAEIQFVQRQRDTVEARLALDKSRLSFSVLLFPNFRQDYTVVDDMDADRILPPFVEIQSMAGKNNPDIRAAQVILDQQGFEIKSARAAMLPSLSFDYFFGMNSPDFALHTRDGLLNVGSVAQAQMTIPLWTWGAAKSKVRQAELRRQQAQNDLTLTQRQLLSNLNSFHLEAEAAKLQIATLRRSMQLSAESLRLTILRYQAGEVSVLEVVDAQSTVVQARNAYDDGMARYRVALANLQTLTGEFN